MSRLLPGLLLLVLLAGCGSVKAEPISEAPVTIKIQGAVIQTLHPLFFGQNYWLWPMPWGAGVSGTESLVKAMNIKFLRAGGINNDIEEPSPLDDNFLDNYAAYCKSIGAEPLLQVPVGSRKTVKERVDRAIVLIEGMKKRGVMPNYISIGNEPDGYSDLTKNTGMASTSWLSSFGRDKYIESYTNIAAAVKKAYPAIKIVGLELGWKYDWLEPFLKAAKGYIDVVSLHRYTAWPVESATWQIMSREYQNIDIFYKNMRKTIDGVIPGLPLIMGELNSSADGDPNKYLSEAAPGSYCAGLWFADFAGVSSAESNIISIMPWSICEGWRTGFLDSATKKPKPIYYTYQMFAKYTYPDLVYKDQPSKLLSLYAYRSKEGAVSVFCVNWDKNKIKNVNIQFAGLAGDTSFSAELKPYSLTCYLFDSSGKNIKKLFYDESLAKEKAPYTEEVLNLK